MATTTDRISLIPRARHIPERSCIACGRKAVKAELARLARSPEGTVRPDPTGRSNGRGAYLCYRAACWEKGLVRRVLERSFRAPVSNDDLEALKLYFIETVASGGNAAGTGAASSSARGEER